MRFRFDEGFERPALHVGGGVRGGAVVAFRFDEGFERPALHVGGGVRGGAVVAFRFDEGFERLGLHVEGAHGFIVALVLLHGPAVPGALHGADAPCDHGDLAKPDREGGGDLPVGGPKARFAQDEGSGFVLGHGGLRDSEWMRYETRFGASDHPVLPARCPPALPLGRRHASRHAARQA